MKEVNNEVGRIKCDNGDIRFVKMPGVASNMTVILIEDVDGKLFVHTMSDDMIIRLLELMDLVVRDPRSNVKYIQKRFNELEILMSKVLHPTDRSRVLVDPVYGSKISKPPHGIYLNIFGANTSKYITILTETWESDNIRLLCGYIKGDIREDVYRKLYSEGNLELMI